MCLERRIIRLGRDRRTRYPEDVRIYWTLNSIPEFAVLPKAEQRALWQSTRWHAVDRWQFWVGVLAFFVIGMAGQRILRLVGRNGILESGAIGLVAGFVMWQFNVIAIRAEVRKRRRLPKT
jgi:hypothetical protein